MKIQFGAAIAAVALTASPSFASDLNATIAETLDNFSEQVEQVRVWKFGIQPTFSQGLIWTDNVYLNDRNEQPYTLTSVSGPNGVIQDKQKLNRIQRYQPDFAGLESKGRVGDWILESDLGIGLVLPVNDEYTKLFKASQLNVLTASLRHHEYFKENDLDSTDYNFSSDVFGFLDDLFEFEHGNRFWVRAGGEYSKLEEPLDTDITQLQQIGIGSVDFLKFERTEWEIHGDAGYRYNRLDAMVGAEYFVLRLADDELRQAEYDRTNFHVEAGYSVPQFQDRRVFVRVDLNYYRPNDRAVGGSSQALNDGNDVRAIAGVEGAFFSEKLFGRVGIGYEAWDPKTNSGLSGDTQSFNSVVGEVELGYRPWEERNSQVQLTYNRGTDASAISNFNDIEEGTISFSHEVVPKRWDAIASFGFTRTLASEGPRSKLYDAGLGVTYHWFEQVDVSLRYSYRFSDSWNELFIESSFTSQSDGRTYSYTSESDGDFYSNTFELALDVNF